MKAKKWIGINMKKSYFIAHIIEENGVHKIQRYLRNQGGIEEFMKEVDMETIVGVDKTPWTFGFLQSIKYAIKDYIILDKKDLMAFAQILDEKEKAEAEELALIIQRSNF